MHKFMQFCLYRQYTDLLNIFSKKIKTIQNNGVDKK